MAKLVISWGDEPARTHELIEERITIGRAPENAIYLEHPSVSGRHAELQLVGESYHLKDLDSTNGTRVNGEAITAIPLRAGDQVRFGKVEACFECEVPGQAQPLPELAEIGARPAQASARPEDFANASPFPSRKQERDPARTAILAAASVALLAFLGSMISVFLMRAPQ